MWLCVQRVVTRSTQVAESGAAGVMLKEAESILNEFGSSRIVLELQFRDEVGSGLGPTLEWYTLISHQLMRKDLEMWRSLDDDESHEYHISADNTIHGNASTKIITCSIFVEKLPSPKSIFEIPKLIIWFPLLHFDECTSELLYCWVKIGVKVFRKFRVFYDQAVSAVHLFGVKSILSN